jgi:phospholipid/cholesterol/gamma-HCH transport system ATP-binding protein
MTQQTHKISPPAIRLENLVYQVRDHKVLEGVSLEIQPGEILAVMGRSGSGKTTILRLIMGLIRPVSGHIWIDGQEITALKEAELLEVRAGMGLVFQNAALFDSLTVAENVAFGLVEQGGVEETELAARVGEYLAMVGMAGTERLYPAELSGGMKKRVGVARALIMKPQIMLYDEPTAGLDPPTAHSLNELIADLRQRLGVTTIIVSHDVPSLAQVADRAALLEDGKILTAGTLSELAQSESPVVREFLLFWKR